MSWSSGTNTIKEGDESKALTLQMLEVKKQGGGTEFFVRKNDVKLGTKSVTQNGTYTAAADGKYGFSQFSVNVRGGNGSADSHGKPTGGDIKPGGAGSAVVGTDPETGNDEFVGVDEDGVLVTTPVPSGIQIVTLPTKTDYNAGETMVYTSLVVKMVNRDGSTYTDADHPNGHLSLGELVLPVTEAPAASGDRQASSDLETGSAVVQPIKFGATIQVNRIKSNGEDISFVLSANHGVFAATSYDSGYSFVWADSSGDYEIYRGPETEPATGSGHQYTYNGKTVYYQHGGSSGAYRYPSVVPSAGSGNIQYANAAAIAWTMIYGNVTGGTATIPVKWINSYTGVECQDTFQITSTPASGDAHTTTGSTGTEGSGGGGTF